MFIERQHIQNKVYELQDKKCGE